MLRYKMDVLWELKVCGYNTTRLRNENLIGEGNIAKLRKGEVVGNIALNRICAMLNKQPGELIEYIPHEDDWPKKPISHDEPLFAATSYESEESKDGDSNATE